MRLCFVFILRMNSNILVAKGFSAYFSKENIEIWGKKYI